jgi:hypothetical protein
MAGLAATRERDVLAVAEPTGDRRAHEWLVSRAGDGEGWIAA